VKLTLNEAHANCRTDDDRPYSVGQHDRSGVQQKLHDRHRDQKHRTPPEMLLQQEPAENRAKRPTRDLAGGPHRDGLLSCLSSRNMLLIRASVEGIRVAPAIPSSTLPMISICGFTESAAAIDTAANAAPPINSRRPIRSPDVPW
jgi:hypothetical protein